jgi:PAS domain S-box-containing protein
VRSLNWCERLGLLARILAAVVRHFEVLPMSELALGFVNEYGAAIHDYLAGDGELTLPRAYEAGCQALSESLGVLGMVTAHLASLIDALGSERSGQNEFDKTAVASVAGELSPFEMVWQGVRDANARVQQSLIQLQSVEEQLRRQNEELALAHRNVEKQRSRYQALFDFAPDGYLVTGMEGAIREANTAAAALLGTSKELLPGQSLHEFVAKEDRSAFRERLRLLHLGSIERLQDWEVSIQPGVGTPIPVALTAVAERATPAVAGLRWLIRDMTARKHLEKERARWLVGRARMRAARRFEFIAEASALLAGSLDVEASLIDVARLAAGFTRGWCFISVVEPDGSLRQLEAASGDGSSEEFVRELRSRSLLGGPLGGNRRKALPEPQIVEGIAEDWCAQVAESPAHAQLLRHFIGGSAAVLPLRVRGHMVGVMTFLRTSGQRSWRPADHVLQQDLARRCALALENARLYQEVVAERDKAERASRAKDEFVAILAHELRNPLTPVVGWTRVLKKHALISQDPVLNEVIEAMQRNASTLTRLIGECVDLTRISEGKIEIERKLVNLNQVVTTTSEAIREMASERGLKLNVELTTEPALVLGDAMRIEQVLMNLLINALKYTDGGGAISILVALRDDSAELEIRDTGIGIDPAFLEQIFEPFRQGTNSWLTSQSGLGLGLAIARRIVEMHGGRVWAESGGLGLGSTFRVQLPLAGTAFEEPGPDVIRGQSDIGKRNARVLLIEDSDDILFLMKTELERMGYSVLTAKDGLQALEIAIEEAPDLLISDIKMPGVDGYQLIRSIRAVAGLENIPAIALTGFGSKAGVERALAAGFDSCLSKPMEPEQIANVIGQLLEQKGQKREAVQAEV